MDLPWFVLVLFMGYEALNLVDGNPKYLQTIVSNVEYAWQHARDRYGLVYINWNALKDKKMAPKWLLDEARFDKGFLNKSYIGSTVLYDATGRILSTYQWNKEPKRYCSEFPEEVNTTECKERPERIQPTDKRPEPSQNKAANNAATGYCTRIRKLIPFDLKRPMCYDAFQSWSYDKNYDFKEKYCHKTGKPSNGKTSMRNPVMD